MKTVHYHNTTNQNETFVIKAKKKFKNQEDQVMSVMRMFKEQTASDVWKIIGVTNNAPLTSMRRAISNLCYEDKLIKTDKTKIGLYGKPEHFYRLSNSQLDLLF